MFSVADVAFYNVSGAQRFVDDSLSYSTRVLSFVGGPCSFPDETLDEDNYFLMCAMHHGYQVQTLPSTLAVNVKVCVCSVCGCVRGRGCGRGHGRGRGRECRCEHGSVPFDPLSIETCVGADLRASYACVCGSVRLMHAVMCVTDEPVEAARDIAALGRPGHARRAADRRRRSLRRQR